MTVEVLEVLQTSWTVTPGVVDTKMLWAAATLGYFCFMRSGELTLSSTGGFRLGTQLSLQDVATYSITKPTMVKARLKASKYDQSRQGCTLVVGSMGNKGNKLCLVAALLGFMALSGRKQGPLFQYRSGKPLTQEGFIGEVMAALEREAIYAPLLSSLLCPQPLHSSHNLPQLCHCTHYWVAQTRFYLHLPHRSQECIYTLMY